MRFSPFIGMIFILLIAVALEYGIINIMKLYSFPFVMAISVLLAFRKTLKMRNTTAIKHNTEDITMK